MTQQPTSQRSELIKFGIVVLIAVIVVLVVALSRPFIFGRVVPAVLGEGDPVPVMDQPGADDAYPPAADDAAADEGDETDGMGGEPETAVPATDDTATEGATAEEDSTITHVVQAGETLFAIARIYDVTVDELVAANNITNPNVVPVGTELKIPKNSD